MIHYCACTGGSTSAQPICTSSVSTLGHSRDQAATSLCKICGYKILADGKGPTSVNMLGTVGFGFSRVIDPDLNWIKDSKAPKGNRRARRARSALMGGLKKKDTTRSSKHSNEDLVDKSVKRELDMPVSESEKLGVTILGRRFSDMIESVPIKKRRFPLVRSPSPPPQTPFPRPVESAHFLESQPAFDMKDLKQNVDGKTYGSDDTTISRKSFQVVVPKKVRDGRISIRDRLEKSVDNVDFYGISILAAAACNSNMGGSGSNGDGLVVEENSFVAHNEFESPGILENTGCLSVLEEVHEKHLSVNNNATSNVSNSISDVKDSIDNNATSNVSSSISDVKDSIEVHVDHTNFSVRTASLSPEKPMDLSRDDPNKENGVLGRVDSSYLRDDRSHWDLNTVMDAWEIPDDATMGPRQNPVLDTCEDGVHNEAPGNLTSCLHGRAFRNEHDDGCGFPDLHTSSDQSFCPKVRLNLHLDLSSIKQNLNIQSSSCSLLIKPISPLCHSELKIYEKSDYLHDDCVGDCLPNKNENPCLCVPAIDESSAGEEHKLDTYKGSDSELNNVTDVAEETKHVDTPVNLGCNVGTVHSDTAEHALNSSECSSLPSNCVVAEGKPVDICSGFREEENKIISPHLVCIDSSVECTTNVSNNIMGTNRTVSEENVDAASEASDDAKHLMMSVECTTNVSNNIMGTNRTVSEENIDAAYEGSDDAKHLMMVDMGNEDLGDHCAVGEQEVKHMDPVSSQSGSPEPDKHLVICNDSGKGSSKVDVFLTVGLDSDPVIGFVVDRNIIEKQADLCSITCNVEQPAHIIKEMSNLENEEKAVEEIGYDLDTNSSFISQGTSNCEELVLASVHVGEEEQTVVADVEVEEEQTVVADVEVEEEQTVVADVEVEEVKGFAIADENLHTADMDLSDDSDPTVSILGIIGTHSVTADLSPQRLACKMYMDDHVTSTIGVHLEEDNYHNDLKSDVSQKDHAYTTRMEMASELPLDDDSQYEDGELRESVVHRWGEDVVEEEGETEHLDYGYSDNRDTDDVVAAGNDPALALVQVEDSQFSGEGSSDAGHVDDQGHTVGVEHKDRGEHEENSELYPHPQGISQKGVPDTRIAKNRAVMVVKKISKGPLGKKEGIKKLEKNKVSQELGDTPESIMEGDHQVGIEGEGPSEFSHSVNSRIKSSGWDQLPKGGSSSAQIVNNIGEGSAKKDHSGAGADFDGISNAGEHLKRVVGLTYSRDLSSRIEVPKSSDVSLRTDRFSILENRADDGDSNLRGEKDVGRGKSSGWGGSSVHMHGRGRGGDQWLDSSGSHWVKHRHSPSYCGPAVFGHLGPNNAAAVAAAKVESSGFVVAADGTIVRAAGVGNVGRVHRRSVNVSSQSVHQAHTRRGSPADREGAMGYSMQIGLGSRRDMSPVDRRINVGRDGSSGYVPSMVAPSHRERYRAPLADDRIEPSLLMERSLARRERSFSPIQRRASPAHPSRSHTKSPSRSRTRSPPHQWASPRRRSTGGRGQILRRRSRSPPTFQSKNRMERIKSPQRPGFSQHMASSIVSSSRNHGSPAPRIHDRTGVDHFRDQDYKRVSVSERSPPGRVLSRNRRYDVMDSPVRLKHDEYYRNMHSSRFSDFVSDGRGPLRHDASDDDRRKHGSRYSIAHFARSYDIDCGKRFHYDVEDGFRAHNPRSKNGSEFHEREYDRGIDTRFGRGPPGRGRSREEKGHLRYGRDGRQNSGFNSFGIQGGDDDVAPRRRGPP